MQPVAWIAHTNRNVRTARRSVSFPSPLPPSIALCVEKRIQLSSVYLDSVAMGHISWPITPLVDGIPDIENITEALTRGPYGKCVYECDNDVCDNQVCTMTSPQRDRSRHR
jgi:hypothetical protein